MNDGSPCGRRAERRLRPSSTAGSRSAYLIFSTRRSFSGSTPASPFTRVWQGVAAGLLGRDAAVAGGWNTAALGIFLHFVIAFLVAIVYFAGTRVSSFLVRHAVVSGLIYGVIVNFVMQYVVIPLSAAGGPTPAPFRLPVFLNSVIGHAFLVGLPVALIARWSATRNFDKLKR